MNIKEKTNVTYLFHLHTYYIHNDGSNGQGNSHNSPTCLHFETPNKLETVLKEHFTRTALKFKLQQLL